MRKTSRKATKRKALPSWEDHATIEAFCNGIPVWSLGNVCYIYGVSPDLLPGMVMQKNNPNPVVKIRPKKSWEIESNPYGVTICEPGPRSPWNDSQPMLPIHLIDGDPHTAWSSYGSAVPDERPEWIRMDLAVESPIAAVALVCSPDFAQGLLYREGGLLDRQAYHKWAARALPNELTIQVGRDAWHWRSVYENRAFSGNEEGATLIRFDPCQAKQILITGRNFRRKLSKYDGFCFSVSGVEVHDTAGDNLALISRGAGVTVSSTGYLMDHDRYTQSLLFGPIQYDLGLKWVRMGADNGTLTWNYVERQKGKFEVDPAADALVTEMRRNGINIILNLDVKANWNYRGEKYGEIEDPAKYAGGYLQSSGFTLRGTKPEWRQARIYELNNIYYDFPGWAWETEEMFEGCLRYVDFMMRHFEGKVAYYEVGNEWGSNREVYAKAVRRIKQNDSRAKIMVCVGNMSEFPRMLRQWMQECPPEEMALLMPDAVGSHPTTRIDAGLTFDDLRTFYWQENREAIAAARALGYKGVFIASEVYSWSLYPPGPFEIDPTRSGISDTYGIHAESPAFGGASEIARAKYLAQSFVGHAGLGMMAFQCNTYFVSGGPNGQGLLRLPVPSEVVSPVQPDAGYYVYRTICTIMDGWRNAEFAVHFSTERELQSFTFQRGERELMVAAWIPGSTADQGVEASADVILPDVSARKVWGIELMNGAEQEMTFTQREAALIIPRLVIRDYPLILRVEETEHPSSSMPPS